MTASVVQARNSASSASGSTITLAFASTLTAGSAIHVFGSNDTGGGVTINSFSDGTNTYSAVLDNINDSGNAQRLAHTIAANVAAGTPTVSCNYSASTAFRGIWIKEIGGVNTSPLDGHTGQMQASPGTGTDAVSSGTATNTSQPALISSVTVSTSSTTEDLSAGTGFATTPTGEGAGWSGIYGGGNEGFGENKRITTTTAVAATATSAGGAHPYITIMAIFDEGSGGGGGPVAHFLASLGVGG